LSEFFSGHNISTKADTFIAIAVIVITLLATVVTILKFSFVQGYYNVRELSAVHLTGVRTYKWDDLVSVTFSSEGAEYMLVFNGGTVRLSRLLLGISFVLEAAGSRGVDVLVE